MLEPSTESGEPQLNEPQGPQVIAAEPIDEYAPQEPTFDLEASEIASFATLQHYRQEVFARRSNYDSFRRHVERMPQSGEPGRRRGLGLWMLGDFQDAAQQLAAFEDDDVASFTRAHSLVTLGRFRDAQPVFERLSKAYPDEPKPRGGLLEAQLEGDLEEGDEGGALERLEAAMAAAPESFSSSVEGNYLLGRAAEIKRDWETALDCYETARGLDPTQRNNLFRMAYLAERVGLDEIALECYEDLTQLHPIDRNALANLGILYEDFGRDQDAAACYETIVRSEPMNKRARLYLEDARSAINMYYDEDLERKEDRLNQILRIPITDFELSVRARNCLNKMNILSLGDLVRQTEAELLSYKNFGETSLNEIKEILASKGLRLGMAREEAVASIESTNHRYVTGENADLLNRSISELELSIRARRTVEAIGCLTLGDITQHSEEELLGMPNFGVTSLQELRAKLTELGLKLKAKA